jgi:shikimate dehydrogenase
VSGRARITGAAKVGGIVGQPVAHSLSPVIHNRWIEAAGLDAAYVPFAPANADGFALLVQAGRTGLLSGVNVTAPFKEQAFELADEATPAARLGRTANILRFANGRALADSSDGLGLLAALAEQAPALSLPGSTVVVLGAGGAARAGAGALVEAGARVVIVNRSRDRAERLQRDLGPSTEVLDAEAALPTADLVVNAVSIQPEVDFKRLKSGAVVMDMTYKPVRTPLLRAAEARGHVTVDGLAMLIGQAGPSFRAIFGAAPPQLDLRGLLLEQLGEPA